MWKNVVEEVRPQITIRGMCNAYWIPKATHTHTHTRSEYVILIAFPLQQWLQECASVLCYMYIASLVTNYLEKEKVSPSEVKTHVHSSTYNK